MRGLVLSWTPLRHLADEVRHAQADTLASPEIKVQCMEVLVLQGSYDLDTLCNF